MKKLILLLAFIILSPSALAVIGDLQSFNQIWFIDAREQALSEGYEINGSGQGVCYLSSGIDPNAPAYEDCNGILFANDNCPRLRRGWNLYAGGIGGEDDYFLGTYSSVIVGGFNKSNYTGLMPSSNLIPLKISDASGNGWEDHVTNAIDWCVDNASDYNFTIDAIQIDFANVGDAYNDTFTCTGGVDDVAIQNAVRSGISVVGFSGLNETYTGVNFPACNPNVTGVLGVCDEGSCSGTEEGFDELMIASNRYNTNDTNRKLIASPMADIRSYISAGELQFYFSSGQYGVDTVSHMTGTILFLKEYYRRKYDIELTPKQLEDIIRDTGYPIYDSETGVYYNRINLLSAINYEEVTPTITLHKDNETETNTIPYTSYDLDHNITNCSLYLDGELHLTHYYTDKVDDTCSKQWGFKCDVEDSKVDNTFNDCNSGYNVYNKSLGGASPTGSNYGVLEVILNDTIVTSEDTLNVKCTFALDSIFATHRGGIFYNDGVNWTTLYYDDKLPDEDNISYNISVNFTASSNLGTHWIRCSLELQSTLNITDFCADAVGGGEAVDNDDVSFTVTSNSNRAKNRHEGTYDFELEDLTQGQAYEYYITCYDSSSIPNLVTSETRNFTYSTSEFTLDMFPLSCEYDTTEGMILFIGFILMMLSVGIFLILKPIPFLNIVATLPLSYFSWYVANCFLFASILFVMIALGVFFKGIFKALD